MQYNCTVTLFINALKSQAIIKENYLNTIPNPKEKGYQDRWICRFQRARATILF